MHEDSLQQLTPSTDGHQLTGSPVKPKHRGRSNLLNEIFTSVYTSEFEIWDDT